MLLIQQLLAMYSLSPLCVILCNAILYNIHKRTVDLEILAFINFSDFVNKIFFSSFNFAQKFFAF